MVNVKDKTCKEPSCRTIPTYNKIGETKGLYCNQHKLPGMIDVKNKTCKEPSCNIRPSFNKAGETKGLYCNQHKLPGMICVTVKTCKEPSCNKQPSFNKIGKTKGLYCNQHKLPGMVNVKDKTCKELGCNTRPTYNKIGETKRLYCNQHKLPGMIDVKNKTCQEPGCSTQPSYGIPGHPPTYCAQHSKNKEGIIKNPRSICNNNKCRELALYGLSTPLHCEDHKEKKELNLVERKCVNCELFDVLDKNKKCMDCDPTNFKVKRLYKQNKIKHLLDAKGFKYTQSDITIDNAKCGKERPDFLFDCKTHQLILEVDENQHRERACECEQTRMVNITNSLGMPTVFLRYNPDDYKVKNKKVKTSDKQRHETLIRWLKYYMKTPPTSQKEFLRVIYMYYDGFEKEKFERCEFTVPIN